MMVTVRDEKQRQVRISVLWRRWRNPSSDGLTSERKTQRLCCGRERLSFPTYVYTALAKSEAGTLVGTARAHAVLLWSMAGPLHATSPNQ